MAPFEECDARVPLAHGDVMLIPNFGQMASRL
jgi:hypothetical protein